MRVERNLTVGGGVILLNLLSFVIRFYSACFVARWNSCVSGISSTGHSRVCCCGCFTGLTDLICNLALGWSSSCLTRLSMQMYCYWWNLLSVLSDFDLQIQYWLSWYISRDPALSSFSYLFLKGDYICSSGWCSHWQSDLINHWIISSLKRQMFS